MPLIQGGVPGLRAVDINDFALNTTLYYAAGLSYTTLDIATFLIRKGFSHTPVRILLPSTLLLYGSTALFMASLAGHVTSINQLVAQAQASLFSDAYTNTDAALEEFEGNVLRHSQMYTAAFTMNLIIGDSIVWWRVCAVWRNRVIYCLGPLLITLILAFAMKALCGPQQCPDQPPLPQTLSRGGFFADACTILSLALNVLSTALIGYKAWAHRRLLRMHLGGSRTSRVMRALAFLVESGTIYCLLMIIVIMFQATFAVNPSPGMHQDTFRDVVAVYSYSCFIPVMAIYPVLIIVIVALNWSPIEHGDLSVGTQLDRASEDSRPPIRPDLNRVTTASAVVFADNAQVLASHSDDSEDGASEVETKRDATVV